MRYLLQFLGIWGAWIAITAGILAVALWAFSLDNPRDEKIASSMLWLIFWPVIWIYLGLTGKKAVPADHQSAGSTASTMTSKAGIREEGAQRFRTVREAKEYLVGVIAKEAERNGTPLTEVERKMLYFTETGWTLPDMREVSSEFDRNYDQREYEERISSIVTSVVRGFECGRQQERTLWDQALDKLGEREHYLLVLVDVVTPSRRVTRRNLKMLIAAVVFFVLAVLSAWFRKRMLAY